MPNILDKYQRQPKHYIDLPSKGRWYPNGILTKSEEVAVYSMTASDEIATKTPDALFSGNTVASIISNCVPDISNAWDIPSVDMYSILAAIRMASYGDSINMQSACAECIEDITYEINLQSILDYFTNTTFIETCKVGNITFNISPISYKTFSDINKIQFKLQRQVAQVIPKIDDDENQAEEMQKIYDQLSELRFQSVCNSISSIEIEEEKESNFDKILNFLKNSEKDFYNKVEETIIKNNNVWTVPPSEVQCAACDHKYNLDLELDYSNFFDER